MADQICIEYHHYPNGQQEVFITTRDGTGVVFPADYLESVQRALQLARELEDTKFSPGHTTYITIDEKGELRMEVVKKSA